MPAFKRPPGGKKTLVALVGVAVASMLGKEVPKFEGVILRGYKDPIGIVTACAGHTKTAVLGKPYTRAECDKLLEEDLVEHAEGVLKCTPGLADKSGPLGAAVSFTFNVGTSAYCKSTMARRFNEGRYIEGCNELKKWVFAGGRQLPGLVKRRDAEFAICSGNY